MGREVARLLPGGGRIETGFDPLGRVARRRGLDRTAGEPTPTGQPDWLGVRGRSVTVDTSYRYSPDGELVEALDQARGRTEYRYDPVGQLLAMLPEQARAELFRFDPRGNLHETDPGAPARVYGKGNRLLQKGNTAYQWDDDGRLVEKRIKKDSADDEVWRYRWDGAGLLHEVERPDRMLVRFAYDPFARRVEKTLLEPVSGARYRAKSHTRFVWDGDVLAHETKIAAQAGGNPVVAERTYRYEDDPFEPVAHQEDGRWVHYVNDQIGTPERLLESGGDVACELRRSAWGQTEVLPGDKASTPMRFQGQYGDEETGLSYNRWRYFEADAGRFVSADPIGLLGGAHGFAYAPNALAWIDPWGLAKKRNCELSPEEKARVKAEVKATKDRLRQEIMDDQNLSKAGRSGTAVGAQLDTRLGAALGREGNRVKTSDPALSDALKKEGERTRTTGKSNKHK
ncbi:MAG: hypothetical protein DRI90_28270 [Deltaproteobacteria bacterium]|nr:MAG: hypothetical protein DRI90_28270 [Deltaproteobacteria bacterium]